MPDKRLERARPTLPEGYQFGRVVTRLAAALAHQPDEEWIARFDAMAKEQVKDTQDGIGMRFVKQFECRTDNLPRRFDLFVDEQTAAEYLATRDTRAVPHEEKLRAALARIRSAPKGEPIEL